MDRERSRKITALRYVLLLPILALAVGLAGAAPPAPAKPKVDRLVMGVITPYLDYIRPWINGTADHNNPHDPILQWLIQVDAETGQYKPRPADNWTPRPHPPA